MPFTPAATDVRPDSDQWTPDGQFLGATGNFFEPPKFRSTPWVLPETTGVQRRLFRYYQPTEQGINVFKLVGGRYTIDQPDPYDLIDIWYLGGHVYEVSDEEAASLIAAGYEVTTGSGATTTPPPVTGQTWGDLTGNTWGDLSTNTWGDFA